MIYNLFRVIHKIAVLECDVFLEYDVDSLSPVVIKVDLTLVQKVDLIQNVLIKLYLI